MDSIFIKQLVGQVRAIDNYGVWDKKSDEDLLAEKYVKTKEQLKAMPIIADIDEQQTKDIRLVFQALALAFEAKTGVMCNVIMEMSHEGFGRAVVLADKIVIGDKYFKDAHRYGFASIEKLVEEGDKMLEKATATYEKFKSCI